MSELSPYKLQLRRARSDQWTSTNPVLKIREPAIETDTGKFKIGNGVTAWNDLAYFANEEEFINIIRELGPSGGPFEFIGADVVMVDTTLAGILSSIALLEAIVTDKIVWPDGPSGGGASLDGIPLVIEYVWNFDTHHYVLANGGIGDIPENAVRMFTGPVDPVEDGFTMNAGDHWFIVEVEG